MALIQSSHGNRLVLCLPGLALTGVVTARDSTGAASASTLLAINLIQPSSISSSIC